MAKKKTFIRAANALLFSGRELLLTSTVILLLVFVLFPLCYRSWEKITLPEDFRLPYANRDNYYLYSRCAEKAAAESSWLLLGDSAIWGMYASNSETLSAQLNRMQKKVRFSNLAIDGLHPVAMKTLMENFGSSIRDRNVLIYFNPLWVNSAKYDLSGSEKFTVNHPELLPQFGKIACYEAAPDKKIRILLDRELLFFSQLRHIRNCFYNNSDFKSCLAKPMLPVVWVGAKFWFQESKQKRSRNIKIRWKSLPERVLWTKLSKARSTPPVPGVQRCNKNVLFLL